MNLRIIASTLAIMAGCAVPVVAQLGVGLGVGLVAAGDGVSQAAGDLHRFLANDSLTFTDVTGNVGATIVGRIRYGVFGLFRLNGDASVAFFGKENVQLTDASASLVDTSINATFEVGTTVVPISAGLAISFPAGPLEPFAGVDVGVTFVSRTFTYVSGNTGGVTGVDVQNQSAGDPELGLAINAGTDVKLGPVVIEIGARYNLANVLSQAESEDPLRYLRISASFMFQSGN